MRGLWYLQNRRTFAPSFNDNGNGNGNDNVNDNDNDNY